MLISEQPVTRKRETRVTFAEEHREVDSSMTFTNSASFQRGRNNDLGVSMVLACTALPAGCRGERKGEREGELSKIR